MNAARLHAARILQFSKAGVAVEVVPETGSTNADLLARAPDLSAPLLLIAEHQTAGRGRAGRSWLSEPGHSLTFSLAWRFDAGLRALTGLPLAVGTALAETLARLGQGVQLKWPNDLLKDGDKLAGILVETRTLPDGAAWAIVGIGVNLVMPDALEAKIGRAVAAVPWLARMDRDELMAALESERRLSGPIPGALESWLLLRSIGSLGLRFERQCQNAMALAVALRAHPKVRAVRYPGLPDDPSYPVRMSFAGPLEPYSRLKTFFRLILAIPIMIMRYVMGLLLEIGAIAAWFVIVVTGKMPRGLFDLMVLATSRSTLANACRRRLAAHTIVHAED